ncbi:ABC transporter ATP-binding protein [Staphylococcus lutrae]|uniref:Methionine ABC transporter ATP-binding protein n=1 Tax=Staphylococcus lutrae TaxID=155085 RepID=A0AAC9RV42_9STAP|nr:ATP-binding cassette domain-containing protein [Staphylococcus lutrae]ARJ51475.1 methionine ABC transporter ATP-binding protein [Staphylococcus lutrae]PNZ38664.1 methionine ABC transporter ATP-binding protein [Staphylococcus lutrae]
MLELTNVSYQIAQRHILKQVNIHVESGEAIAVVGPSGSGKSTLLKVIADLLSPTEGDLCFKGKSYDQYKPEMLRQHISYLPQSVTLLSGTIRDNLAFPAQVRREPFDKAKAKSLMAKVGLKKYRLSDKVQNMSGGEKQRITIVRQLMFTPDLLMLDEATSALDDKNSRQIEKLVFDLVEKGMSVLWITHNTDQSQRQFHRKIEIQHGSIAKEERLM